MVIARRRKIIPVIKNKKSSQSIARLIKTKRNHGRSKKKKKKTKTPIFCVIQFVGREKNGKLYLVSGATTYINHIEIWTNAVNHVVSGWGGGTTANE